MSAEVSFVEDGPASSVSAVEAAGLRKAKRPIRFLPSIESWSCTYRDERLLCVINLARLTKVPAS